MQHWKVLRGCLACYLFGILISWLNYLATDADDTKYLIDPWRGFVISIGYGAYFAVFLTIIVLMLWGFLAYKKVSVPFWAAPLFGILALSVLLIIEQGFLALIPGFVLGGLWGLVFWVAAFGKAKAVRMHFGAAYI